MKEQQQINHYTDDKEKIINYVENSTGLKRSKSKDTIMISEYAIEDDKVTFTTQVKTNISSFLIDFKLEIAIGLFYLFLFVITGIYTKNLISSIYWLDLSILDFKLYSFVFFIAAPILVWLLSTNSVLWNYTYYKVSSLIFIVITLIIRIESLYYLIFYNFFIPVISRLKPNIELTPNMIVGLGYLSTLIPMAIFLIPLVLRVKALFSKSNIDAIKEFKLKHHLNFKKSNPYAYDQSIITNMDTGKKHTIKEHDRYIHTETTGATGTAKTSSCLIPAVLQDLLTKAKNVDAQKKEVKKLISSGKAYLTKEFDDIDFSVSYVKPNPGYEKEFNEKVLKKYRNAGITVIAPDDSLTDNVYKLAKAKGFNVNRVDPKPNPDGTKKEDFIGFNPLYISPSIPEWSRKREIVKRATLFADVMQIVYEMNGKSDPYFTSINRIATTTTSILLCVTFPLVEGRQPTPRDVQEVINNLDRVKPYYKKLKEIDTNNEYQVIKDIIENEFLGLKRQEFEKHCSGLRTQLNNFLLDDLVTDVLCAEKSIDLDRALKDGEITVCNIELGDLGPVNSPAFGLFFSISYLNAVLRRPGDEWSRPPHFCYIDELPIIISPSLEACFTLFRKFRVAMFVALQTMDQFNKNPFLQYLKGIIINSCGHHIVFGRANVDDMNLFSTLGGMVDDIVEMKGITQTTITLDNPTYSESDRYTVQKVNRLDPYKVRDRDFQELTFFTVDQGRPLPPIHGRVFFLRDKDWKPIKRFRVNWMDLFYEQTVITRSVVDSIDESANDISENVVAEEIASSVDSTVLFNLSNSTDTDAVIEESRLDDSTVNSKSSFSINDIDNFINDSNKESIENKENDMKNDSSLKSKSNNDSHNTLEREMDEKQKHKATISESLHSSTDENSNVNSIKSENFFF
ncbi:type IV secretory system conjugative DNA transfer family protein [Wukongibacter baidiensis]